MASRSEILYQEAREIYHDEHLPLAAQANRQSENLERVTSLVNGLLEELREDNTLDEAEKDRRREVASQELAEHAELLELFNNTADEAHEAYERYEAKFDEATAAAEKEHKSRQRKRTAAEVARVVVEVACRIIGLPIP